MKKKWMAIGTALCIFTAINVALAEDDEITILIHGNKVNADAAKLENGTMLVPLRVVAENLNQDVQWNPNTRTVTIEPKEKPSEVERLVIQKNNDIFITEHPESLEANQANQALIFNLKTLYHEGYRGLLHSDAAEPVITTEDKMSVIQNSRSTQEGSVETSFHYVRLVQKPYMPQTSENAPARKDLLFYIDPQKPNDLYMAVQNPEKPKEWAVYCLEDYGKWFLKEIDAYLWPTRGIR